MRHPDDHGDDMSQHRLIHDDEAESILGGAPHDGDLAELARFVAEVRRAASATTTPVPSAAWAAVLDAPEPLDRRTRMPVPPATARSLAGKITIASVVALAALGTGAAAGYVPAPITDAVAATVRTISPFETEPTDEVTSGDDTTTTSSTSSTTTTTTIVEEPAEEPVVAPVAGPAEGQSFGDWVSEQAHADDGTPGVDGQVISAAARAKHDECDDGTPTEDTITDDTVTDDTVTDDCAEDEDEDEESDGDDHGDARGRSAETPAVTAPGRTGDHRGRGHGGTTTTASSQPPTEVASSGDDTTEPASTSDDGGRGNGRGNGKGKGRGAP